MDDTLFQVSAATRIACLRMTDAHLQAVADSADRAICLPARSQWGRKASAYAEIFALLAESANDPAAGRVDPAVGRVLADTATSMRSVMFAAGRGADGMIASSRRRLLACLRARDAEGAAREMEEHLRGLHFMSRLIAPAAAGRAVP
jgi:DNA-binding FadR family transcriptional regulator